MTRKSIKREYSRLEGYAVYCANGATGERSTACLANASCLLVTRFASSAIPCFRLGYRARERQLYIASLFPFRIFLIGFTVPLSIRFVSSAKGHGKCS